MTWKNTIVIMVLSVLAGFGIGYLVFTPHPTDPTVMISEKEKAYNDTIRVLRADNKIKETEINDLETHIEFYELTVDSLKQRHEKSPVVIRSLSPDESFILFTKNVSSSGAH